MKFKILFLISLVATLSLAFAYVVQAPKPYRGFSISVPDLVEANPGELIKINGTILNFGLWWLHDFNLTAGGLPEDYTVIFYPSWFEHVRILREWNPEQGLYLVPEKFSMTIKVPEDAVGVFTVSVTGQEFMSWKRVSNSTAFIFRVASPVKLSVSDIVVPETVTEFKPFDISFAVKNEGTVDQPTNISVIVPSGWSVAPAIKAMTVKADSSESVVFTITPTNTSGEISVLMMYPYKAHILNITKAGPVLIPAAAPATTVPTGLIDSMIVWFEGQLKTLPTWFIVIAVVFLIIVLWSLYRVLKKYRFRIVRKKPEEIKKQVETQPSDMQPANNLLQNFEQL